MANTRPATNYETLTEVSTDRTTLIEGLPGHGLVASITVDLLTDQLDLNHCGNITSDAFPPVTTFADGLVRDLVRVYGCEHPAVMTLQSDMRIPESAYESLGQIVIEDVVPGIERAIFLAAAPARSEEQLGDVTAIATTEAVKAELEAADVAIADERGVVGGVTGALVRQCYEADVPAALLVVKAHPQLPDPRAAKAVIESALEPLVEFDVDTTRLDEQADEIQGRMEQVAAQFAAAQGGDDAEGEGFRPAGSGMYQ